MAEFKKVMKQRSRMCEKFKQCNEGCPIYKTYKIEGVTLCRRFIIEKYEEAEEIIIQWAKENPVKTNRDKFKEVFGVEVIDDDWCLCSDSDTCEAHSKCDDRCEYYNFWNKEYIERNEDSNED